MLIITGRIQTTATLLLLSAISSTPLCAQDVVAGTSLGGVARFATDERVSEKVAKPLVKRIWDVGFGYASFRFNSSNLRASTGGLQISIAYHVKGHFAWEGQIASTFGDPKPGPFDAKYLFYGGGAALNGRNRRIRPFVHGLIGGLHMFPQTQFSTNGIAALTGCGADVQWKSDIWVRVEGDYVRSQIYRAGQNNVQLAISLHATF